MKKFKPEEIRAIKLVLEHKANLADLGGIKENVELREGPKTTLCSGVNIRYRLF